MQYEAPLGHYACPVPSRLVSNMSQFYPISGKNWFLLDAIFIHIIFYALVLSVSHPRYVICLLWARTILAWLRDLCSIILIKMIHISFFQTKRNNIFIQLCYAQSHMQIEVLPAINMQGE